MTEQKRMKILVVTSQVTFVPKNYNLFLESLFSDLNEDKDTMEALIILKNSSPKLLFSGMALLIAGARNTGFNLIKNYFSSLFFDHQKIADKYGVKTLYFNNPNDASFIDYVKKSNIDLIINARTRFIYKKNILNAPKLGCLNIHHGILPQYRGTMCDLYALSEGRPAGFSIHKMEPKIDAGDIISTTNVTNLTDGNSHSKNFCTHTEASSKIEGLVLSQLLKTIKKNRCISIKEKNDSTNALYSKNPDRKTIRKMISEGLIL